MKDKIYFDDIVIDDIVIDGAEIDDVDFEDLNQQETGKAKSKAQRRLFGMALSVKRGTFKGTVPPHIKKMADSMTEEKLKQYAGTKQKKRRKDGSVGKRNNIPYKVDKKK